MVAKTASVDWDSRTDTCGLGIDTNFMKLRAQWLPTLKRLSMALEENEDCCRSILIERQNSYDKSRILTNTSFIIIS